MPKKNNLPHADTMFKNLDQLRNDVSKPESFRIIQDFGELLELACSILEARYDDRDEAIDKLGEFLQ